MRKSFAGQFFQCPKCGAKTKHCVNMRLARSLIVLFSILFFVVCIYFCFVSDTWKFADQTQRGNETREEQSTAAGLAITLEQYNAVETGISVEEMFAILGGEGTVISESTVGEGAYQSTTVIYGYEGTNGWGASANFMIQNNKVVSKSQIGLG